MPIKSTPSWRVGKILRTEVTLSKVTETPIGSTGDEYDEYHQVDETLTTYKIKCEIIPMGFQDFVWIRPGVDYHGDAVAYFKPSYRIRAADITVELKDYITHNSVKYVVDKIDDFWQSGQFVVRRAILKRSDASA